MDEQTWRALRALPALDLSMARSQALACKVCGAAATPFDVVDFNKHCSERAPYAFGVAGIPVAYFRCGSCGLLFTPFFDDWPAEAFAAHLYNADYVKVDGDYVERRPRSLATMVAAKAATARGARVLDYGSGAGVFAACLAEHGFPDVTSYDPFSSPGRPEGRFDLVTCFEVIEHATAPDRVLRDIAGLLAEGGCVLLSTGIQPDDITVRRASWWYVGPRNGHASIFTFDALALLGRACGLTLHLGGEMIAFTGACPSDLTRSILAAGEMPFHVVPLAAPAAGMSAEGWHACEGEGGAAFRWTRSGTMRWPSRGVPALRPCRVKVVLPFRIEIVPGFAAGARLFLDDEPLGPVRSDAGVLSAEGTVIRPGPGIVALQTPEPIRPGDLGPSPDRRMLGLAVPIEAANLAGSP